LVYPNSVIRYRQLRRPKTGISDKFLLKDRKAIAPAAIINRK